MYIIMYKRVVHRGLLHIELYTEAVVKLSVQELCISGLYKSGCSNRFCTKFALFFPVQAICTYFFFFCTDRYVRELYIRVVQVGMCT